MRVPIEPLTVTVPCPQCGGDRFSIHYSLVGLDAHVFHVSATYRCPMCGSEWYPNATVQVARGSRHGRQITAELELRGSLAEVTRPG